MLRLKILIPLVVVLLGFFTILIVGVVKKDTFIRPPVIPQVSLTWWRVFDDEDAVSQITRAYQELHSNVSITYRKLRYEEYESELLNAMAEDRSPDIISLHNTWLPKYASRLTPLPFEIKLPRKIVTGSIKKEESVEYRITPVPSAQDIRENFLDVVEHDTVWRGQTADGKPYEVIMGIPLVMDTLALFVNRDLLNQKGLAFPPKTWEEFQNQVITLTEQNPDGGIDIAGAALGGAQNIPRFFDLVSVLMMQNGVVMEDNDAVSFNKIPRGFTRSERGSPASEALSFYTDFARPSQNVYTWNESLPNALEMFTSGNLAFFFGYAYNLPIIRVRAPKLNLLITPLPQLSLSGKKVNYANYWLETVSKKTKFPEWAWDFLLFATKAEQATSYLAKAKKPAALRTLLVAQANDPDIKVFAEQALTAQSWYRGSNAGEAEKAFSDMIRMILSDERTISEALEWGAGKVGESY